MNELNALKNRKIDLSDEDTPEITSWEHSVIGKFYRPVKKQITIRIDVDVLEWFRHVTSKYQTLINAACREYMLHHAKCNIKSKKEHALHHEKPHKRSKHKD